MAKTIRVVIEDAWRLKGRRPPAKLTPYFSLDEWSALTGKIYNAILPAIGLKQVIVWLLTGLFAIPLLSFTFLLAFVLTGIVEIQDLKKEFEDEGDDDLYGGGDDGGAQSDNAASQEAAFELLLLITTCGCVGLSILCLLFGSALRNCYFQKLVDDNLEAIIAAFDKGREHAKDGVAIELEVAQPERKGIQAGCRQAFMSWCDLEYDFRVSIRDNFDDYNRM